MKRILSMLVALTTIFFCSCIGCTTSNSGNGADGYGESSLSTESEEDSPYLDNRLQTGAVPYDNYDCEGQESTISVATSANSDCDVVVIVKQDGYIVRNVYIEAGDSYTSNPQLRA